MKLQRILVLLAAFPLAVGATTITSGTITIFTVNFPGSNFNFSGPGFSASGGLATTPFCCGLVGIDAAPGSMVSVDASFSASEGQFGVGSATVDGMTFDNVNWGLSMGGPAPPESFFNIAGPPITLNGGPATYQSTFTFSGNLCAGPAIFPLPPHCTGVELPNLTGAGVVSANLGVGSDGRFFFMNATYNFTVPEPGTWMLVDVGLLVAVAHRGTVKKGMVRGASGR